MTTPPSGNSRELLTEMYEQAVANATGFLQQRGVSVSSFMSVMDVFAARAADLPVPEDVICKAGCAYCCHLRVSTSIPEVIIIADRLRQGLQAEALAELTKHICSLAVSGDTLNQQWWWETSTPCPFLHTGNAGCGIYSIRPFTCRAHHSTNVSACRHGFEQHCDMEIPGYTLLSHGTDMYANALIAAAANLGLASYQIGFIAGLAVALEDEQATAQWLAGEDVFATVRIDI